jgi:hypothetical protein
MKGIILEATISLILQGFCVVGCGSRAFVFGFAVVGGWEATVDLELTVLVATVPPYVC